MWGLGGGSRRGPRGRAHDSMRTELGNGAVCRDFTKHSGQTGTALDPFKNRFLSLKLARRPAGGEPEGCPACGSRDTLYLRARRTNGARGTECLANSPSHASLPSGSSASPPPPPPVDHALLSILQPWVQVLGRSTRRLGTSVPSFPLVHASMVPCAWRPADSGPVLDSPARWRYDTRDHGRLCPAGKPPALPQPSYAMGLWCSNYGKLRAAGVSEAQAGSDDMPPWSLTAVSIA